MFAWIYNHRITTISSTYEKTMTEAPELQCISWVPKDILGLHYCRQVSRWSLLTRVSRRYNLTHLGDSQTEQILHEKIFLWKKVAIDMFFQSLFIPPTINKDPVISFLFFCIILIKSILNFEKFSVTGVTGPQFHNMDRSKGEN